MTNNRLWAKAVNTQQQKQPNKTSKRKSLAGAGN